MAFPVAAVMAGLGIAQSLFGGKKKEKGQGTPLYQVLQEMRQRRLQETQGIQGFLEAQTSTEPQDFPADRTMPRPDNREVILLDLLRRIRGG